MKIPFTGQTSKAYSRSVNGQETVNWYPAKTGDGKHELVLYPTPGLKSFASIGTGPFRGAIETSSGTFIVTGNEVYKLVDPTGGVLVGTIGTTTGHVSMAFNPTTLVIVDGSEGYYVTLATAAAVTQITTTNFPGNGGMGGASLAPTHIVFVDGYFLVNDPGFAGRFQVSPSYFTGTEAWDNSLFATAERSPDILKAISVNHRTVYLHGANTTEPWYNSGSSPMPFTPIASALLEVGMEAAFSVTKHEQQTVWLAKSGSEGGIQVIAATGPQVTVISTPDLEYQFSTYTITSDAEGWCYQQSGHAFYVLTFPTQDITWVYDFSVGAWHNRASYGLGRWRATKHAMLNNKHIVGDYNSGAVYTLDHDTYTDNGDPIVRTRITQHIHDDNDGWLFFSKVYLEFEHGVGDNTTTNPLVSLQWSDDHGNTWANELFRSLGAIGNYKTCAYFNQLGRSKDRVFKIIVSDPVKAVFLGGYAEVRSSERPK